ncbi:MAG: methyl-accepting chemotaxis protein [Myxococcota bacterium]|nr:methyl-accepting chemotaxis protein [Myxococcota bacterium]
MGIRIRLFAGLVLVIALSGGIAWGLAHSIVEQWGFGVLNQRADLIGRMLQGSSSLANAFATQKTTELNQALTDAIQADPKLDYLLLVDQNSQVLGWTVKSFEQIEDLGLATPDDRQAKVADYNAATESGSRLERLQSVSLLFETVERPIEETTEGQVDESAEAQADQVITTRTLPARLLAGYSEDALAADHDMGLGVVFRSLLPCVLLASLLFWWLVGQLLEQIRAVKSYAERLSGGDLSEGLDLKDASDVSGLAKALNTLRRSFMSAISSARTASEGLSLASSRIKESSNKITEEAVDQSNAIRQTISSIDVMIASSTSVQAQITEATKGVVDSTETMNGIRKSIETVVGSMQMLSKSVDQTRRHLEGNVTILGEVDREVNKLQETATSTFEAMADISENIRHVEDNTEAALKMASEATENAERGVEAFKASMAAIQRIRSNSDESANSIRFLSAKAESIEHILDFIDDISNRTRLLSLNASIIASHAGESGRGFMIVADEIKDLASRTAGAVREISKIIREVREGSDSALEVVERGVRAVNEGVKRAELAGEILTIIMSSTIHNAQNVRRISSAMDRQLEGTKRVNSAMREVHNVIARVRDVVTAQKNESRDLESSIRTIRIQMSRATTTAKQQNPIIQEALKSINLIQNQIHLIQSTNEEQIKNQQNVASAVERLKALSDAHHASASNLALAAEQSEESTRNANEGFLAFRV